jgi:glucose-1-phosphate thymidylyltransferase
MKALILCGGKGTRLAPLSNNLPKQVIPVANKPIIYYILEQLVNARIKKIGIVVSPDNKAKIRDVIGDGSRWGVKLSFIEQRKPRGLAHAVKEARHFIKRDNFILILGDNLIQDDIHEIITTFKKNKSDALVVIREVEDPRMFGIVTIDEKGKITKLIEKPKEPETNLAILGIYVFSKDIYKAIDNITPSWRGEYEITDAIQNMLESGNTIDYYIYKSIWHDIGNPEDLLTANKNVLESLISDDIKSDIDSTNTIKGKLNIGENVLITSSNVTGPTAIGDNCIIFNSKIGHYTSIGENTIIRNSTVDNCIIMSDCHIENINGLSNSVIGRNSHIFRGENGPKMRHLIIGDDSKIELG